MPALKIDADIVIENLSESDGTVAEFFADIIHGTFNRFPFDAGFCRCVEEGKLFFCCFVGQIDGSQCLKTNRI